MGGWGWLAEDTCNYWRDTCICYNGPPLHPAHQLWTALSLNGTKTVVRGEVFLFVELGGGVDLNLKFHSGDAFMPTWLLGYKEF